jgi:hypothetical protein
LAGLPVTLFWRCCSFEGVDVVVPWFGFAWAKAKLVPSTMMIAAMLAIFFMCSFLSMGLLPLPRQRSL